MKYLTLCVLVFPLYSLSQNESAKSYEIHNGITHIYEPLKREEIKEIILFYDSLICNVKENHESLTFYLQITENKDIYDVEVEKTVTKLMKKCKKRISFLKKIKLEVISAKSFKAKYGLQIMISE